MRTKYLFFVVATLLMVILGANATNNYSIFVGAHEVRFNTSSSFFEENEHKATYWPVFPGQYGLDYSSSSTDLLYRDVIWGDYPDIYRSDLPFLHITIRDFKGPIPWSAQVLELETIKDLAPFAMTPRGGQYISGDLYAVRHKNEFNHQNETLGIIVKWPTDQIEIIMTGSLPNVEIWEDISHSIELVR